MNILKKWFDEIDNEDITYFDIYQKIDNEIKNNEHYKEDKNLIFEAIAFWLFWYEFEENRPRWTYYWPFSIIKVSDTEFQENPWRSFITKQALQYWWKRAFEEDNPLLKLRYADIVFDLYKMVDEKFNYKLFEVIVDSTVKCFDKWYFKNVYGRDIVNRWLSVAISSWNKDLIEMMKKCIINLEDNISQDDLCWLRWFSFDYLFNNKKIVLSNKEIKKIIDDLEDRFSRISNIFWLNQCLNRLLIYYASINDTKSILDKLDIFEKKAMSNESISNDDFQKNNFYQNLIELYSQYEKLWENIKNKKNDIINKYQEFWKNMKKSWRKIKTNIIITDDEIENYQNIFIKPKDSIIQHIQNIIFAFKINIENMKNELGELVKKYPILYLINKTKYDENWMPIMTIWDINEDYDGNLYNYITQNIQLKWIFLWFLLDKLIEIDGKEKLTEQICNCSIYSDIDKEIIIKIMSNYYNWDYINMNYLILPFIERVFRKIIYLSWWMIIWTKNNKWNLETHYLSLDILLKNKIIENIFWKDSAILFNIILTEKYWLNLRNIAAHWLDDNWILMEREISNILLCILLYLSLIKNKNE